MIEASTLNTQLTCVSGYWKIKNKHGDNFNSWFANSLKINCPYVFFGDDESLEQIKIHRSGLPTHYIKCDILDFFTYKYKNRVIVDPTHCPSAELNLIWNEKIFLVKRASEINPFSSDFFCWVDAGICVYRHVSPPSAPFPNLMKLKQLPTNKFIYSSSNNYLPVSPNNHTVSGTAYVLHRSFISTFAEIYCEYLDKNDGLEFWTDQIILTRILQKHPQLFSKLCNGYGKIVPHLM